ncbi:hypothetical protein MCOR29_005272 [Pyricularia oryzae]|nr:hypothetical protein MCOR26_006365 [Pyricularia oryzae]KAI6320538.1 hypothetical protein MCOR29_005272 [Pyricularia oryzae]KAI6341455.1 hypothetical protein MCOR28_005983 [Pyricularia oryzae]KAI6408003.1 hypothetical protein MCOR20_005607 [Pyricularia oryzae]KAI6441162.1 hypothetical protein MCOR22_006727 [Pyricularia oryzae]
MQGITFAAFLLAAAMPVIVKVFLRAGHSKSLFSSLPSSIRRCIRFVQLLAGGEQQQQQRGGIYPSSPLLGCCGGDGETPQRVQQRGRPVRSVSYNDAYARNLEADHDLSPPTSLDDLLLRNIRGSSRPPSRSGSRPPSRSNSRPPSRSNSRPSSRSGSRPPSLGGAMSPMYAASTIPAKPTRRPFLRKSSYDSTHSYNASVNSVSSPSAVTGSTSAVFDSFAIGLGGACDFVPPSASDCSPRGRGRTRSWNVATDAFSSSSKSSTSPANLTILEVRDGIVYHREVDGETGAEGDMGAGAGAGVGETADLVDLAAAWASSRGVDTNVGLEHFEARSMLGRAIRKFKAKSRRLKQMGAREQVVREARENWARRSLEYEADEWAAALAAASVVTTTTSPRSSISSDTAPPTTVYHASVPNAADPTVLEAVVEVPHLEKTPVLRPAESMDSLARDIAAVSAESELPHSPVESVAATARPVSRGKAGGKTATVGRRLSISIRGFKKRSSSAPENRKRAGSGATDSATIGRRRTMLSWGRPSK